jgi:hypothetical protein
MREYFFEAPKLALTRVEAADALDVSPATLDRLVKRGLLRPSRALRRPLFSIAEIKRFLRETSTPVAVYASPAVQQFKASGALALQFNGRNLAPLLFGRSLPESF